MTGARTERGRIRALIRNRDFALLWSGQVLSEIGSQATTIAMPLLVLALTGSAAKAGLIGVARAIALPVSTLPAGVLADRVDRRRLMMACAAGRMVAIGSVALGLALGHPSLGQLLLATLIDAIFYAAAFTAERGLIGELVAPGDLADAVTLNEGRSAVATLSGPAIGGALFGIARSLPFVADTASFVTAFAALAGISARPPARAHTGGGGGGASGGDDARPGGGASSGDDAGAGAGGGASSGDDARAGGGASSGDDARAERGASAGGGRPAGGAARAAGHEITEGLRWLWGQPFLRAGSLMYAAANAILNGAELLGLLIARRHGASSAAIGGAFAIVGGAGVVSAMIAGPLRRRLAARWAVLTETWVYALATPLFLLLHSAIEVGLLLGVIVLPLTLSSSVVVGRRLALTPDHLRGRVQASANFIASSVAWMGPLAMGLLFQYAGETAAVLALCGFTLLVAIGTTAAPALRRIPAAPGG